MRRTEKNGYGCRKPNERIPLVDFVIEVKDAMVC